MTHDHTGSPGEETLHDHAYLHAHGIAHSHGHVHANQKAVINRLARAIGHLEKVKRMVEEGYDCSEVLVQLAAVRSALDNAGKVILQDHMRHCMVVSATSSPNSRAISRVVMGRSRRALIILILAGPAKRRKASSSQFSNPASCLFWIGKPTPIWSETI